MPSPTANREEFLARRSRFHDWLTARGADILAPTNEWELCRFGTEEGVSIVYTNKRGSLTWCGRAGEAYAAFKSNAAWRAGDATKRRIRSSTTCLALRKRDGDACFFCHLPVAIEDESPEHLVAVTHGGPDHTANMALAHRICNNEAGHLSLMEKIRFREECWRRLHTTGTVANLALRETVGTDTFPPPDLVHTCSIEPLQNDPPWET